MEGKYSKPGFDGRLKYYEHLKEYWGKMADATFNDDYDMKYKALRGYLSRVIAFVKDSEKLKISFVKIRKMIRSIDTYSSKNKWIVIDSVFDLLQNVEDELFMATKDMLVSTKDDSDDEFDMDAFLRQSD